ncbi:MAG: RidA family protein [Candidatus Latescibacteria bacterium]|nr:RidA family protein [Candidatus Latescibacterota bacterium]
MEIILTPDATKPGGHYSQATIHGGFIFISGQLPIDPSTGGKILGSIEEQTEAVLRNVKAILEAAGSDIENLLKVTVYVSDIGQWDQVNTVYAEFMGDHKPARAIVPTRELHYGFKVEMDAIAAVPE